LLTDSVGRGRGQKIYNAEMKTLPNSNRHEQRIATLRSQNDTHAVTGWLASRKKNETSFVFLGTPCMFTRAQSNPHMTHLDSSRRTLMASRTGETLWFQKTAVVREMYFIKGLLISMVARLSACH
jgi:hypothetical protein